MLYMNILTWDPDKRDDVMKRAQTMGFAHEGIKVLGTWADIQGSRCYQLTEEAADPKLSLKANFEWNDIVRIQSVQVMEAEELLTILGSMK
jgi:hypothetical protein